MKSIWSIVKNWAPAIAVGLALVPAAHAGVAAITGGSIVNGTVTGLDIRNGSISTADVGSLTSADIANGTLTSADVRNGSITAADIAPATVAALTKPDPVPVVNAVQARARIGVNGALGAGSINVTGVSVLGAGRLCVALTGVDLATAVATTTVDWARSTPDGVAPEWGGGYRKAHTDVQASVATAACPTGVEVQTLRDIAGNMQMENSAAFGLVVA